MKGLAAMCAGAALVAVAALSTGHPQAAAAPVSFTAAQAGAGEKAFAAKCSMCHGASLEGGAGPALSGPNFKTLSSKVHATVSDIFTYMTTNMPMNAPASLPHTDYVNIMAFILSKNGYRPGGAALSYGKATSSKAAVVKE